MKFVERDMKEAADASAARGKTERESIDLIVMVGVAIIVVVSVVGLYVFARLAISFFTSWLT